MGQYYYCVNTRKRQYLHPHSFGCGLKLLEFGASGSGTMMGLAVLLADGNNRGGGDLRSDSPLIGSWAGDPIVLAGDYADPGSHVPPEDVVAWRLLMAQDTDFVKHLAKRSKSLGEAQPTLYAVASALYENISDQVILALCDDPYERQALIERGADAAKTWKEPKRAGPFKLE